MISFPNAKINIGLNVINKRADGYHEIETVFVPIAIYDILEIVHGRGFSFNVSGLKIGGDIFDNLVVRAFDLMRKKFFLPLVNIHLHKSIPIGAGLGGGSSDAAFTIKLLNDIFELNLSTNKLLSLAEELCSDCPFFILNKPSFATGRGEKLTLIDLPLRGYTFVVIYPNIHISSAEAYKSVVPRMPENSLRELIKLPPTKWKDFVKNDFELILFSKYPILKKLKEALYSKGAIYASISGSGSSIYGIFSDDALPKDRNIMGFKYFIAKPIL